MRIGLSLKLSEPKYNVLAQNIRALFADGSQGWWYDDNDTTTLFQDSAGTTPVTAVEQFVGLQLDKSKGLVLGPELVTNGDFSAGTTGWILSAGVTVSGGTANWTAGASNLSARQTGILTVGKTYQVTYTISSISSGGFKVSIGAEGPTYTSAGTYTARLTASSTQISILSQGASTTGSIDNISVRELPGNHRYAPASGNRPIWSKRVNLLTKTEQFDDAAWVKVAATVTQNATTAPDGTATADKLIATVASSAHCITQNGLTVNSEGKFLLYAKSGEYTRVGFRESQTTGNWVVFDLNAGTVLGSSGMTGATISPAGNGWYLCSATQPNTATQGMAIHIVDSGWTSGSPNNRLFSGNGVDGIFIWGADLRPANQATGTMPLYQRVNTSSDYDTNGFPGYLKADGVDDFLQTNSIDFSAGPTNPPLGPELVVNGDGTTLTGWTSVTDPGCSATVSGGQFVLTTIAGSAARLRQSVSVVAGRSYAISVFVNSNNVGAPSFDIWGTNYGSGSLFTAGNGVVINRVLTATVTATSNTLYLQIGAFNSGSGITNYYDNISVKEITNANLGADKITLCAGVRKLSDAAAFGCIAETSTDAGANNGAFALYKNNNATSYYYILRGSVFLDAVSTASFTSPITNVLQMTGDISGSTSSTELTSRINGASNALTYTNGPTAGTGNLGNYQAYFFRRGGTTLPFNGNEYGNVAVGKLLTADQLTALETYMNGLTKAY